ncbi:MAG: hypothetical protein JWN66_356 [Sphingomonas bacterium]|uniref:hypothetical protein n=1 Tax=Sphingomonas bacterium TaxID=1895847 RepID=UPI00261DA663|nr:hypothetical protein [Sphingomonas bacterium]MDB5703240.1 hypothetical protein [Sphingomonas bacterium]
MSQGVRPIGGLAAMLLLAGLAGCGPAAEQQQAPAAPPPKPSFDQTVPGVQATIAGLGAPWAKPRASGVAPDPATGGTIIFTDGDRGEAKLHRLPDGWISQVGLTSGAGKRCGDPADVERAIPLLLTGLATNTMLSAAQAQQLKVGLAAGPPVTIDLRGVRVTAQGGCVQQLTVTAVNPPASPSRR